MKTKQTPRNGFTLVEIMIVVAIIGLLAAIAVPNFVKARKTSQKNTCINNLRLIDAAKQQWASEYKKAETDEASPDDVRNYIKNNEFPVCPASGAVAYEINQVGSDPACPTYASTPYNHNLTP